MLAAEGSAFRVHPEVGPDTVGQLSRRQRFVGMNVDGVGFLHLREGFFPLPLLFQQGFVSF